MRQIIRSRSKSKHCPLCAQHSAVDYKDALLLKKYVSERGKILSRLRTGACSKHQRQLTKSIKRARVMALLPFAEK